MDVDLLIFCCSYAAFKQMFCFFILSRLLFFLLQFNIFLFSLISEASARQLPVREDVQGVVGRTLPVREDVQQEPQEDLMVVPRRQGLTRR